MSLFMLNNQTGRFDRATADFEVSCENGPNQETLDQLTEPYNNRIDKIDRCIDELNNLFDYVDRTQQSVLQQGIKSWRLHRDRLVKQRDALIAEMTPAEQTYRFEVAVHDNPGVAWAY